MSFKKLFITFTVTFFISLSFGIPTFAEQAVIQTDHLNVRSGPGTDYERIAQVHTGEVYPIIKKENNWVQIKLVNGAGWITTDYVSIIPLEQEPDIHQDESLHTEESLNNETSVNTVIIKNDQTHIRNGPSTDEEIIGFVKKGTVLSVLAIENDWYKVQFEDQHGYIYQPLVDEEISLSNNFRNKTIVIDAGHGGRDIGAFGASGTYEKDLTIITANQLVETLSIFGADVILTRKNGDYVRLGSRSVLPNIKDADVFLSIHYNSFPEMPSVTGIGTFYYANYSRPLANTLQQRLIEKTDAVDRGIAYGNYLVLRQSFKPAALLELGFISNSEEEQILWDNHYQTSLTSGIVSGLATYFINPNHSD